MFDLSRCRSSSSFDLSCSRNQSVWLLDLPSELLREIFTFLSAPSIVLHLSLVNSDFLAAAHSRVVCQVLLVRRLQFLKLDFSSKRLEFIVESQSGNWHSALLSLPPPPPAVFYRRITGYRNETEEFRAEVCLRISYDGSVTYSETTEEILFAEGEAFDEESWKRHLTPGQLEAVKTAIRGSSDFALVPGTTDRREVRGPFNSVTRQFEGVEFVCYLIETLVRDLVCALKGVNEN